MEQYQRLHFHILLIDLAHYLLTVRLTLNTSVHHRPNHLVSTSVISLIYFTNLRIKI